MDPIAISRFIDPHKRRVRNMAARNVLDLVASDDGRVTVQIHRYKGMTGSGAAELFQEYGFASRPLPGAEVIHLNLGGNDAHVVVIATEDRRYRLQLEDGDAALYDNRGQKVHLRQTEILIETPLNLTATVGGDATATVEGNVTLTAGDEKVLRLAAGEVQIHAKTKFRFDVNGHGQQWNETSVDTYQTGEVGNTANAIVPPEIP